MKKFLISVLVSLLAVSLFAGCSLGAAPAAKGTLKIGFMTALTGNNAAMGADAVASFEMFLEQHNNVLGGFNVEVVWEDDAGNADQTYTKIQKLVEMDEVDVILGPSITGASLAAMAYADEAKVPVFMPTGAGDDISQRKFSPYGVRLCYSSSQCSHPEGEYVAKVMGKKKAAILAQDFAFGYEVAGGFQRAFEDNGGKVIYRNFSPNNQQDFSPYLSQIPWDEIDVFWYNFTGGDSLRIQKQLKEFGYIGKVPIVAGVTAVDESVLPQFEPEVEGFISSMMNSGALDTPENKKLAADFGAKYGRISSLYAMMLWTSGLVFDQAFSNLTPEDLDDPLKVVAALRNVKLDKSPIGPVSFDEYNQFVGNIYIRRVEMVNGTLQNTVIDTYENVSQFWTYDPKEFMSGPAYSRDFPPVSK